MSVFADDAARMVPPLGHTRVVTAVWAQRPPVIDGVLDDDAWLDATRSEDFWIAQSQQPPSADTVVQVLFDDKALYVAFRCYDAHPDAIRAMQIRRDGSPGLDDRVTVELDPYHNHRTISRFTVTARGTQSDALAGGRARKIEWKGNWQGAAHRDSSGWTAEMAIPLEMLDFQPGTDTFGINFVRYQSRTREWSSWANVTPRNLPEEAGHLTGLWTTKESAPNKLTVMQSASAGLNTPAANGGMRERSANAGVDVRYEWRGRMTSVFSARPDFSEVDPDVLDLAFSYNEKLLADHRPFFQEGAGFFGDRTLFHSARVGSFDVGAKTFGRVDAYQMGVLAVTDSTRDRTDYVGRVVREFGPAFNSSVTIAGTSRPGFANNVVQMQSGGRLARHWKVGGSVSASATQGRPGDGTRLSGSLEYQTNHWFTGAWSDYIDLGFLPANGFIAGDVIGTRGRGAYTSYNRAFGAGWLRRADASVSYERRDTVAGDFQRENYSLYGGVETGANVQVNAGMSAGPYRPRADEPGKWTLSLNDDRYYTTSVYYTQPTGRFGLGTQYAWGFLAQADYRNLAPSMWVMVDSHLSLSYSFERAAYWDVQSQHVLSGTWQMTPTQTLSARWVQYDEPFFRVSYRRAVSRGFDVFGVYSSDPYRADTVNLKLVWTLRPFSSK